jgi:transglutaminase-like putative cysteine protease
MVYQATHTTRYRYQSPVSQSQSEARLTPRTFPGQTLHEFRIRMQPEPAVLEHREDYFGNEVTSFAVFKTHEHFSATATSIVEVEARPWQAIPTISWEATRDHVAGHTEGEPDSAMLDPYEFVFDSPYVAAGPELGDYARPSFPAGRPVADAVTELSHRIHSEFRYAPKSTSIDMPLLEVLGNRCGVCQDFAHVMIAVARSWGIPTRYVSGYLHHRRKGQYRSGEDATHAWVEAYLPSLGWLGFDPTNDIEAGERHIRVAVGRDYADVPPTRGTYKGEAESELAISVTVEPTQAPVRHEEFLRVARPLKQTPQSAAEKLYHQQQQQQQ